ncbi:amino acid/amide ABC transporter substrate-binding protein, HAAT family [Polaromonas naphthalenivorans CJ2]|uniref:Amino acid/amide ABC transporter substrate-binding protein, HAAT family n=2 Tax=Polaromonas naphthalenivorans TaxID=216465 RepID=A1VL03_POLNA|nr:amino acid/amide ABC transporter substrate-binding protein, HAAT family [Polaromonas naphthalenivorans CJ2]
MRTLAVGGVMAAALSAGAAPIVVGQVAPLSGMEARQGRAYSIGIRLALNKANTAGGVNGNTFSLVSKDDGGRSDDTLAATRLLLSESRPLVLAGYFGDRSMADLAGSGLLGKEKIALVGYRVNEIREEAPLIYSVRATLRDEINKIVEHLATVGITRLGLFYPDGPGAAPLIAAMEDVAKKKNVKLLVKGSYKPDSAKVAGAVIDAFIAAAPQAIIIASSGSAAADFIEKYRMNGGAAQLFAHSGADIEHISQRLGEEHMKGMAIAQVTPNPYKISGLLSKEFIDTAAKTPDLGMPVSYAMMEGYIAGSVIVEAARRMGPKVSREGFVSALESIDNLDMGGYKLGFKPGMRSGSKFVELTIVTATGRIRQ